MFDRVAPRYDALNRLLSLGRDRAWRERAIALARLGPGEFALDVGVGTGDLAFGLLHASDPLSRVVGIDVSPGMIAAVRSRAQRLGEARFAPLLASAYALPFADARFNRVVAGFTVRNFGDLGRGLAEMRRVLRPGGRAVILELSTPPQVVIRSAFRMYFDGIAPRIATLAGGDADAYRYLPRSVAAFPAPEGLTERLEQAGFTNVRFERLSFGIAAIHIGEA